MLNRGEGGFFCLFDLIDLLLMIMDVVNVVRDYWCWC